MVPFLLGLLAYPVGERQRLREVTEPEDALQSLDALPLHQLPIRYPRSQLRYLRFGKRGLAVAAGAYLKR